MAIDRIPGVGPQNTDIATAVAAAVPTIAAITSSITTNAASAGLTNASITSAGNAAGWGATGPTTTQIAAAVPTLAQITSAVTTNAASAGVTMAAITSTVQANAGSPFGGTYTNILNSTIALNATTYTISGLAGYKYLKIAFNGQSSGSSDYFLRCNSATTNHSSINVVQAGGQTDNPKTIQSWGQAPSFEGSLRINNNYNGVVNQQASTVITIANNNATVPFKQVDSYMTMQDGTWRYFIECRGIYHSTAAIDTLLFFTANGTLSHANATTIRVWGAN
jgi:hypothetical protein